VPEAGEPTANRQNRARAATLVAQGCQKVRPPPGWDAGADIRELPDARLTCQLAHRPTEEREVGPHRDYELGICPDHCSLRLPIGSEVALHTQPVIVSARYVA
jgi:hypothetical protein